MSRATIVEVGLRDGLQNESVNLSVDQRFEILKGLIVNGLTRIEVGAFVRSDRVPQMAGTNELLEKAIRFRKDNRKYKDVKYSVLIPNLKGWQDISDIYPDEVAFFASSTESFSQKNINCSIEESFERFAPIIPLAKKKKVKLRGYLSVCFGCPFEGTVPEKQVILLAGRFFKMKIDEVSIGDTIGVATAGQVSSLFKKLKNKFPIKKMAGHFHDTRGQALANILVAYQMGVRVFDSSLGGLGGCPYAPGATGNVATEDVVYLLDSLTKKTGLNLPGLIQLNQQVGQWMAKSLPSKLSRAGLLKPLNQKP